MAAPSTNQLRGGKMPFKLDSLNILSSTSNLLHVISTIATTVTDVAQGVTIFNTPKS